MINKIIVCAVLSVIAVSNAAFALCQTYAKCNLSCRNSGGQCCAEEKTTYDCPSGWYASGSTCYRNSTDAGSDAKGYKKTIYGSCAADVSKETCYMCSRTGCL